MTGLGRQWLRCARGVAAIEFALVGPVVILLVFGMMEVGWILFLQSDAQKAADALARYAHMKIGGEDITDAAGQAAQTALLQNELNNPSSGSPYAVAIRPADLLVSAQYFPDASAPCAGPTDVTGAYMEITLNWTYSALLGGWFPMSGPKTTKSEAVLRCRPDTTS